jgi:hypothetical protein
MTGHRIIKNLTKQGNAVLGVGVYSAALAASNGLDAIKVGTNIYDPWLDFKALVLDNITDNPHLPKIKSFYRDDKSSFYVCVMEKLARIHQTDEIATLVRWCEEYVEGHHTQEEFIISASRYSEHVPDTHKLIDVLNILKQYTTHIKQDIEMMYNSGQYDDCQEDGRRLDLHVGNFMLRGKTLVIIDPWCSVYMDDVEDLSEWAEDKLNYDSYSI